MLKKKRLIDLILIIILISGGFILSSLGFIHTIQEYTRIENISRNDLQYEKLTFEKYEVVEVYKVGTVYEIYFEEYKEAFCVHPIIQKALNKETIKKLEKGTKLEIYYTNSTIKNSSVSYISEICEMKNHSNICLALEDYKSVNQDNQIMGMIICPIVFIFTTVLLFLIIKNRGLPSMEKNSRWV